MNDGVVLDLVRTLKEISASLKRLVELKEKEEMPSVIGGITPIPPTPPAVTEELSLKDFVRIILEQEEGIVDKVYPSVEGGTCTAGIGHKLSGVEALTWAQGEIVTPEQRELWFVSDVAWATVAAKKWLNGCWDKLNPLRQALAVCMAFQMGGGEDGILEWKATAAHVAKAEWADVKVHILASLWYKQTPGRAQRMANMWVSGQILETYETGLPKKG